MMNSQRGNKFSGRSGGKKFGGGKDFGKRSFGGGGGRGFSRDSGRPSMHKAICDECGNECVVPFKPNGDKPVYCNNCFKKGESGPSKKFEGKTFSKNSGESMGKDQFEILNAKLDRILKMLD